MRSLRAAVVGAAMWAMLGQHLAAQLPTIELRPGLVITRSVRIAPKVYRLSAPGSLDDAAERIRDHGDFSGLGSPSRLREWLA